MVKQQCYVCCHLARYATHALFLVFQPACQWCAYSCSAEHSRSPVSSGAVSWPKVALYHTFWLFTRQWPAQAGQWPEVYDLYHTFLHVALISRDSRMAVGIRSSPDNCTGRASNHHCYSIRISFCIPALPPPPLRLLTESSGQACQLLLQLMITAAACCRCLRRQLPKCCSSLATQQPHLSHSGWLWVCVSTVRYARGKETCIAQSWVECQLLVEFLVGNIVKLHVPGICHLAVGYPAAKAELEAKK